MPIQIKGSPETEDQPIKRTWTRKNGWETTVTLRGTEVSGQIPSLQQGAVRINYIERSDGVFDTLEAVYNSFNPEDPTSEQERATNTWEMSFNTIQLSIKESSQALTMEAAFPGAIDIVTEEVRAATKREPKVVDETTGQYKESEDFLKIPAEFLGTARALRDSLRVGVKTFKSYAPIVLLNQITDAFTASTWELPVGTQGIEPRVFTTTDLFRAMALALVLPVPIPFSIIDTLPEGQWLERPASIRNVTAEKIQVTVGWEWAVEWNPLTYLNRI